MTQYNSVNVKLSNSQFNKLKSEIKNETEVALSLSSNMIGNSYDEANFPHKLLLTKRPVANLCKVFANNVSANIKLLKNQLSKIIQPGRFFGNFFGSLAKIKLLGLTATASAGDAGIHKKS